MAAHMPFSYVSATQRRPLGKWDEFKSVELKQKTELEADTSGSTADSKRLQLSDGRSTTFFFMPSGRSILSSSSSSLPHPNPVKIPPPRASPLSKLCLDLTQDPGEEAEVEVRLSRVQLSDQCQLQVVHEAESSAPLLSVESRDLASGSGTDFDFATQLRVIRADLASGFDLTIVFQPSAECIQLASTCERLVLDIGGILSRRVVATELAPADTEAQSSTADWTRQLLCSPSGVFLQAVRDITLANAELGIAASFTVKVRAAIGMQNLTSVHHISGDDLADVDGDDTGSEANGDDDDDDDDDKVAAQIQSQVRWLYPRLEEEVELQYTTMRNNQLKLSPAQRAAFKGYPMKRLFLPSGGLRAGQGGDDDDAGKKLGIPLAQELHITVATRMLLYCTMRTRLFASEHDFYMSVRNGFDFMQGGTSPSPAAFQPPPLTADQAVKLHRQRTELLSLARRASFDGVRDMPLVYQSGVDRQGRPVVVAQLPAIEKNAHLLHLLYSFDTIAKQPFSLLLCLADTPSSLRPSSFDLLDVYRLLPHDFRKNCVQLVLFDPPIWVRKLVHDFRSVCKGQARKLKIAARPEQLSEVADIDASQLHLPARYYPRTSTAVFGEPLPEDRPAAFIVACIAALEANPASIHTEGLFRISASHLAIKSAIEQCTSSALLPSTASADPHFTANILKRYLHVLPESLLPRAVFLSLCQLDEEDLDWAPSAAEALAELPAANALTLNILVPFLKRVEQCGDNLMNAQALGTCIGPTLCSISPSDLLELRSSNTIVEHLLANCDAIFPLRVASMAQDPIADLVPMSSSEAKPPSDEPSASETWKIEKVDSETFSFQLVASKQFLRADKRSAMVNSISRRKDWEKWRLHNVGSGKVTIQSAHKTWLNSSADGRPTQVWLSSDRECPPLWTQVSVDQSRKLFAFRNSSGHFLKL